MDLQGPIFVAGHRGMVGSALVRLLAARGYSRLLLRTRAELDLCDRRAVREFFQHERPGSVFLAAAKVGGIVANAQQPVEFLSENLQIELNVIDAAFTTGVGKLLFLGSSCIYPKFAPQPLREDSLLTGSLEPTNASYALAKICGLALGRAYAEEYGARFIGLQPCNLYGPGDNFSLTGSHVLPALIRKLDEAQRLGRASLTLWGSGTPLREFLHVDDLAEASLFLMENHHDPAPINVGSGEEISICDVARQIASIVGFKGEIRWDETRPDGTPRKVLESSRLRALGWSPRYSLATGLPATYQWWVEAGRPEGRLEPAALTPGVQLPRSQQALG